MAPTNRAAKVGSAPAWRRRKYAEACARADPFGSPAVAVRSTLKMACVVLVLASEALTTVPEHPATKAAADSAAIPV
jgi:hypothetical protein